MVDLILIACAAFVIAARAAVAIVPATRAAVSVLTLMGALVFALNAAYGYVAATAEAGNGRFAAGALLGSILAGVLAGGLLIAAAAALARTRA
jgi:hypothetical protein